MFKDALKKSTFVQNICDTVNYWFPRDSIFYAYRTRDLIMMRLTRLACGLPDFIDGVQFKDDAAVRQAFGPEFPRGNYSPPRRALISGVGT